MNRQVKACLQRSGLPFGANQLRYILPIAAISLSLPIWAEHYRPSWVSFVSVMIPKVSEAPSVRWNFFYRNWERQSVTTISLLLMSYSW